MNDALPLLLFVGLCAAALTALWNGYEARQLHSERDTLLLELEELKTVINGNADVVVSALSYIDRMQTNLTVLNAKSDLYDLALSIRKNYPEPPEILEATILKVN